MDDKCLSNLAAFTDKSSKTNLALPLVHSGGNVFIGDTSYTADRRPPSSSVSVMSQRFVRRQQTNINQRGILARHRSVVYSDSRRRLELGGYALCFKTMLCTLRKYNILRRKIPTYLDVDFTNVLWLWNVFYLKLSAYLYMMLLCGVCIIKVHCVSSHHELTISV